ncbi:MAG: D-alanine--D-alanine ligase [bacterium]
MDHKKQFSASQTDAEPSAKTVSFFEFWPTWLMYMPVGFMWIFNALKYRSITLPFIANPVLNLSGMVGVPKSELMQQATGLCREAILNWNIWVTTDQSAELQAQQWIKKLADLDIVMPFVCKPDIGCRGSGVKLIRAEQELIDVIGSYPTNTRLIGQTLANSESEAGVFFVKYPGDKQGKVVSLTFKVSPIVVGDGKRTLAQLVADDDRAVLLLDIYKERHLKYWNDVVAKDKVYSLVFSASHCRGAVFYDARAYISDVLEQKINALMDGLPEFYYGRLDIKYPDLDALQRGEGIEIIEINGASAESIHIWDKNAKFLDAIKTLLWQYNTLFKIGDLNRKRAYKTPGLSLFLKHLKIERRLAKHYPSTD